MDKGTLIIHKQDKRQAIITGKPFAKFYQEYNPHGWADYGTAEMAVRIKYVECGTEYVRKVRTVKRDFYITNQDPIHASPPRPSET